MSVPQALFEWVTPRVDGVAIPEGSPEALRAAAKKFSGAATEIEGHVRQVESASAGVVPTTWFGFAAWSFKASAGASATDLRVAPTAFRTAAAALEILATELQAAQELAEKMRAASADLNARSERLDQQYATASHAEATAALHGETVESSALPGLVGQAGALQFEAAAIRTQAAMAVEQAREAAVRAAAAFDQVASMSPSLQRAAATMASGTEEDPGWDPVASLQRGDTSLWWELVFGRNRNSCLVGPGTYGGDGSFIAGPDGLLYPLVVPKLTLGGVVYSGNRGTTLPGEMVSTLGGSDPGWTEVYRLQGTTRLQDPPSTWEKIFIGFAGTNPNLQPPTAPFGEDDYGALMISPGGIPFIQSEKRPPQAAQPPPVDFHVVSPAVAMVNGEMVVVDRNAPETWNREIRRSGLTPNRASQRASAGAAAVDLAGQVLDGISLAQMSDDYGVAAYQVSFEVNDDGRRRALLRTYAVSVDRSTGEYIIAPSHVYVGEDGEPAFDNILYHQGPEIRPADLPYRVVQFEDEEFAD